MDKQHFQQATTADQPSHATTFLQSVLFIVSLNRHCIYEVLLSPEKHNYLENVATVDFLVDFHPLIQKNVRSLATGVDKAPNHHRSEILTVFDND